MYYVLYTKPIVVGANIWHDELSSCIIHTAVKHVGRREKRNDNSKNEKKWYICKIKICLFKKSKSKVFSPATSDVECSLAR